MDDMERQLIRCFAVIFPHLDETVIQRATMESVEGWDSVATVTLISVAEEEFRIQIDPEDLEELVSFSQFLNYLRNRVAAQK